MSDTDPPVSQKKKKGFERKLYNSWDSITTFIEMNFK